MLATVSLAASTSTSVKSTMDTTSQHSSTRRPAIVYRIKSGAMKTASYGCSIRTNVCITLSITLPCYSHLGHSSARSEEKMSKRGHVYCTRGRGTRALDAAAKMSKATVLVFHLHQHSHPQLQSFHQNKRTQQSEGEFPPIDQSQIRVLWIVHTHNGKEGVCERVRSWHRQQLQPAAAALEAVAVAMSQQPRQCLVSSLRTFLT